MSCGCKKEHRNCRRLAEEKKLCGAKFELRAKCGCLIACGRTNSEGEIYFSDLPAGTYMLKETEAPKGWECEGKTIMIEIGEEKMHKVVEVFNRKNNGGIKVIKLGKEEKFVCENDDCDDDDDDDDNDNQ